MSVASHGALKRTIAWPATLAIVATFVLAPSPVVAEELPTGPVPGAEPAPAEPAPAEPAPAEPAPAEPAPAEPAFAAAAAPTPTSPTPTSPTAAAPVINTYVPGNLGMSISPAAVLPGEDFTFTLSGCAYVHDNTVLLQIPVLQVVRPDLVTSVGYGDDVLGDVFSGAGGLFEPDPWVHTSTVAPDAAPGDYRIYPRCQTREQVGDDFIFDPGPYTTLTVLAAPQPTVTIAPSEGYPGDEFTATIANCPDSLGPNGYAITQDSALHSGPASFLSAFSFVSASHIGEPKPYRWEVRDDAVPGVYTIVFSCYTDGTGNPTALNAVTFEVLDDDPAPTFTGVSSIDPASGYAGDAFTLTGTGCADGMFDVSIDDPAGFLDSGNFVLVDHNSGSGADTQWITLVLTDGAAPGTYTWLPQCTTPLDEFVYDPVVYTLLEPEPVVPDEPTDNEEPVEDDVTTPVTDGGALLPDTGAQASPQWLLAALLSLMLGGVAVVAGRRQI